MRPRPKTFLRQRTVHAVLAVVGFVLAVLAPLRAADLDECRKLFLAGQYRQVIELAERAVAENEYREDWRHLLIRALMETGQYPKAQDAAVTAASRYPTSIQLRLHAHDAFRAHGNPARARELLREINYLAGSRTWAYTDPPNLVALGRAAVLMGAEPKLVLENFYERAKSRTPELRDTHLAIAELALAKGDYDLASRAANEGLKKLPGDADLHHALARAWAPSDRRRMGVALDTALRHNTNHVPALLLLADHLIDAEDYAEARTTLDRAMDTNPWHPDAWAYRAVIAHLKNDSQEEAKAVDLALKFWTNNPAPVHLIGRKLSAKYRFAEGAAYQRKALGFDTNHLPARIQLAQDLLRLGEMEEGWRLANEVHETDGYDVLAYNLVTLRENLAKFRTLTNEHFVVRMSEHEAEVYGQRVLGLLEEARSVLVGKYGAQLHEPTFVEIFPQQRDFAIRTFGELGGIGFLGVCFGRLITANSPASTATGQVNWESVLWHEFCHVVTLQMTRNKMPRWLSEGISVYEELQRNPAWGQSMNPKYREMVLGEDLTPVSELSAAFLTPKSPLHLQFAYYQSAMVVEFLIQKHGIDALRAILRDLAAGVTINDAIAKHTAPIEVIEKEFAAFAKDRAEKLAPGLEFERLELDSVLRAGPEIFSQHPKNFWVLTQQARKLIADKQWQDAKKPLQKLLEVYPSYTEENNAYSLLALVHRELGETDQEREVLERLAARAADAPDAYLRLMELHESKQSWPGVRTNAQRFLAVNPLQPQPYRYLARASESVGAETDAIGAYRTMLLLDPPDPAGVHFSLARLLHKQRDDAAKRHVLQALEEAPRFREAHRLLLEINRDKKDGSTSTAP
jgi:tetratricopeptide (TPR) repeat protein